MKTCVVRLIDKGDVPQIIDLQYVCRANKSIDSIIIGVVLHYTQSKYN